MKPGSLWGAYTRKTEGPILNAIRISRERKNTIELFKMIPWWTLVFWLKILHFDAINPDGKVVNAVGVEPALSSLNNDVETFQSGSGINDNGLYQSVLSRISGIVSISRYGVGKEYTVLPWAGFWCIISSSRNSQDGMYQSVLNRISGLHQVSDVESNA